MSGPKVLVVYATTEGHTAEIAQRIVEVIGRVGASAGVSVDISPVQDAPPPEGYDAVVAGGPIHAAHHDRHLVRYLRDHAEALNALPAALFQVSLTSVNPDERHTVQARALLDALEADTGFDPDIVGMFAGALLFTRYGWLKRHVMRAIARREGGDTDTSVDHDYTDWEAVEDFASDVAALVTTRSRTS